MLTNTDILSMTKSVIDTMRKNKARKDAGIPEYHSTYAHSVEMKQAIEIHAIIGKKPDLLLAERYPNQTPEEFKYGLGNYQQTTVPIFLDTVHTMHRAFSEDNWSVDYRQGEDEENDIKQYLEVDIRETSLSMSYYDYMFNVALSQKLIDAQGVLAYKPDFIPTVEVEGQILIDGQVPFSPIPHYYPSDSIVGFKTGEWYMFLTDERSWVEYGNTRVQEGLIFEVYDTKAIYKVIQIGKQIDFTFQVLLYFEHNLDFVPVDRLKGIPAIFAGDIIFQSPFLFATPCLNDVVLDSIMLRSIKAASVFPYRVMTGNICQNTMEINGEIQNCQGTGWFRDLNTQQSICCNVCLGTGMKDRISPHGVLLLKPETAFKEGELKSSQPAMYYVEPSVATPAFLRSEIDANLDKARNILHLRTSASVVKGSENLTATGQVLDEKALISVVKTFRDQLAASVEFGVKVMGMIREGDSFEMPVFRWSNSFDFTSEAEYLHMLSEAINKGLPSFVVYATVYKYIASVFYDDAKTASIFELLMTTDRLLVMPYDQINIETGKGTISPWEVVLHDSGISIIKGLIEENASYLEQEVSVQKDQLIAEAQRIANEARSTVPTSSSSVVDAVLSAANVA